MGGHFFRKLLVLPLALVLIAPPLTGVLSSLLGGSDGHVHHDHVWHAPQFDRDFASAKAQHAHADEGESDQASHCDHIHLTVMMLIGAVAWEIIPSHAIYQPPLNTAQAGRISTPQSRPPQRHG